jgi:hypothetical protein
MVCVKGAPEKAASKKGAGLLFMKHFFQPPTAAWEATPVPSADPSAASPNAAAGPINPIFIKDLLFIFYL